MVNAFWSGHSQRFWKVVNLISAFVWPGPITPGSPPGYTGSLPVFGQRYPGESDIRAHFRAIEAAFNDPRSLTVDGKQIFYLFRPIEVPNLSKFCEIWRGMAIESGLPGVHFIGQSRRGWDNHARDELSAALGDG